MTRQEMIKYVASKLDPSFKLIPCNEGDYLIFLISKRGHTLHAAACSMSGLEMLQNSSDQAIKNLIDVRLKNSLKSLKKWLR